MSKVYAMKEHIEQGGNVTHLLKIKITKQETNTIEEIRQEIFQRINNIPITFMIRGLHVTITWKTISSSHSAYFTDVAGIFGDVAVKLHTEMLLKTLLEESSDTCLCDTKSLTFFVTKPLTHKIALL